MPLPTLVSPVISCRITSNWTWNCRRWAEKRRILLMKRLFKKNVWSFVRSNMDEWTLLVQLSPSSCGEDTVSLKLRGWMRVLGSSLFSPVGIPGFLQNKAGIRLSALQTQSTVRRGNLCFHTFQIYFPHWWFCFSSESLNACIHPACSHWSFHASHSACAASTTARKRRPPLSRSMDVRLVCSFEYLNCTIFSHLRDNRRSGQLKSLHNSFRQYKKKGKHKIRGRKCPLGLWETE